MNAGHEFVFGYGSLVAEGRGCVAAVLEGWRRCWGVAMDNGADLPGYKSYRLRSDASRPAVFVAFLDIEPDPASAITGVCMAVDAGALRDLDRRERNYVRVDVTSALADPAGRVWVYRGSAPGRARLRAGRAAGRAVVSRDYLASATAAVGALAPGEAAGIAAAASADGLGVLDLERVELV